MATEIRTFEQLQEAVKALDSIWSAAARNKAKRKLRLAYARFLGTHTQDQWEALKAEFGYRCVCCGLRGYHLDKDHITPIYAGGSDGLENIQPLCAWCNAGKGPDSFNWVEYRRTNSWEGAEHA